MVKIMEKIKTGYLVELSNETKIQIDPIELPKVLKGIESGGIVILKQGIFNPSYFVDIVLDEKRIIEVMEENKLRKFAIEQGTERPAELKPLKDIFKELNLLEAPKKDD